MPRPGRCLWVRVQRTDLPDDVLKNPDRVLITFRGAGDQRAGVTLGQGISTTTLELNGRSTGAWPLGHGVLAAQLLLGEVATARLNWDVAGLDLPLRISTRELEAAGDFP